MTRANYDVVIVGASIAGCTAAILLARQGATVALIERNRNANSFKRTCTHFLQPSAVPTLDRLGLAPLISAAGAARPRLDIWTPSGWIADPEPNGNSGYNIRREKLDPILRQMAADTKGVDLFLGHRVAGLIEENGVITGVRAEAAAEGEQVFGARLVVGADGRQSQVAKLAGMRAHIGENRRVAFFAYFRDVQLRQANVAQAWFADPDVALAFPTDDGVVIASVMSPVPAASWQSDKEGKFRRLFSSMPDAPSLEHAERISPILGANDLPVIWRNTTRPGFALIGDAGFAPDPIWGVGCGWAFQSAEWLADCVTGQFERPRDLDQALRRYRKIHRRHLIGHAFHMANYATGRNFYPIERLLFSAATKDPLCAERVHDFGHRNIGLGGLLAPKVMARAVSANLRGLMHRNVANG